MIWQDLPRKHELQKTSNESFILYNKTLWLSNLSKEILRNYELTNVSEGHIKVNVKTFGCLLVASDFKWSNKIQFQFDFWLTQSEGKNKSFSFMFVIYTFHLFGLLLDFFPFDLSFRLV